MREGEVLLDAPTANAFSQIDTLKKAFIKPPPIALLDKELEQYGVPQGILTVDSMIESLGSEGA
jgi:hypothetical protein